MPAEAPLILRGCSPAARQLRADMDAAVLATRVLIECERGIDASELAAVLHCRAGGQGPLVTIPCAAMEPAAVERVLFGESCAARADVEVVGDEAAVWRAAGGTLVIGGVSDLSAAAQRRLARVARDREVVVGGTPRRLDLRLVGTLAGDADGEVRQGQLRDELLRQLAHARVAVPPLRHRREDIGELAAELAARACQEARQPAKTFTRPAVTLLAAMPWRGNVAELRAAIARLVATAPGPAIRLEDVLVHARVDSAVGPAADIGPLRAARHQFERDYVTAVLRHHGYRMDDAARALGMLKTNLYRKVRQLGITMAREAPR